MGVCSEYDRRGVGRHLHADNVAARTRDGGLARRPMSDTTYAWVQLRSRAQNNTVPDGATQTGPGVYICVLGTKFDVAAPP